MEETTLLRIALVCSLSGLVIIFFISDSLKIEEKSIGDLDLDNYIKVKGRISEINIISNAIVLEIEQRNMVDVVLFKEKNISLKKGMQVEVTGKVESYNGKKEIMADFVRLS